MDRAGSLAQFTRLANPRPWEEHRSTPDIRRRHDANVLTECNSGKLDRFSTKFREDHPTLETGSRKKMREIQESDLEDVRRTSDVDLERVAR